MVEATKAEEKKRVLVPISPSRVHLSEYKQVRRTMFAPVGTTKDDIQDPDFWKHVARDLRPCDEMAVFCEDMTWRAYLCVLSAGPVSANVVVISFTKLSGIAGDVKHDDGYAVEWAGPHHKFRIIRKANGKTDVIQTGFGTSEEAEKSLTDYRKTISRVTA